MSVKLGKRARHLRATDTPLTLEQVASVAPSVLHDKQGVNTMSAYQHLSTARVLAELFKLDYGVVEVGQANAERDWQLLEAKHLVRLRKLSDFGKPKGETIPELCIVNAHNASSKLHFYLGMWRLICSNGLMAGTTVGQFSFYHNPRVVSEIDEAVKKIGKVLLPKMLEQVTAMQKRKLSEPQQLAFARAAYALRWPEPVESVLPEDLLAARREADAGAEMWRVFNRIQENITNGGFPSRRGSRTVAPITAVTQVVNINRDLWDLAAA